MSSKDDYNADVITKLARQMDVICEAVIAGETPDSAMNLMKKMVDNFSPTMEGKKTQKEYQQIRAKKKRFDNTEYVDHDSEHIIKTTINVEPQF